MSTTNAARPPWRTAKKKGISKKMKRVVLKFERTIQSLKPKVCFLHIGKTGGLNIASHFSYIDERGTKNHFRLIRRLLLPKHFVYISHSGVPKAFRKDKNLIFIIRNPIDRFVSAFYYLVHNEAKRSQADLNQVEKDIIANFSDVNDFIATMKDDSHPHHSLTKQAFSDQGYIYYRMDYKFYFGSVDLVNQRLKDILLIGEQENYGRFIDGVNQIFGTKINPTQRTNKTIKKGAPIAPIHEEWLRQFLTDDYEIYETLRNHVVQ